jgi:hypothetical protein
MKIRDERGITHNLMLGVLGVLVLGAVSFAGVRVYNSQNNLEAQAAAYAWTPINTIAEGGRGGGELKSKVDFNGCKMPVKGSKGTLYQVIVKATKTKDGISPTIALGIYNQTYKPASVESSSWKGGKSMQLTIQSSKALGDKVWYSQSEPTGGGQSMFNPELLVNCK